MTDRVCGHTNPVFTYCNTGLLLGGATVKLVAPMIKRIGFLFSLCAVAALSAADFLYVSKRRNHGWNYLFYFPRATWITDGFRSVVLEMIHTNQPRSFFASVMRPIDNSKTRFIASIHPDPGGDYKTQ